MATLSLDLRVRILASYDECRSTREEATKRYRVSLGMVEKLLQQRRTRGDIRPQWFRCGRKPKIARAEQKKMRAPPGRQP
jgi:transposase